MKEEMGLYLLEFTWNEEKFVMYSDHESFYQNVKQVFCMIVDTRSN